MVKFSETDLTTSEDEGSVTVTLIVKGQVPNEEITLEVVPTSLEQYDAMRGGRPSGVETSEDPAEPGEMQRREGGRKGRGRGMEGGGRGREGGGGREEERKGGSEGERKRGR